MDIDALVARLAPRLWLVVVLAVVGGVAGFALSRFSPPAFASEARLLVGQTLDSTSVDYTDLLASQLLAQTYADLASTSPVLERAAAALQPPMDPSELGRVVAARAPTGSIYVVITAQAPDGARAAAIANAMATSLQQEAPTQTETDVALREAIQQDLASVDDRITAALAEIGELSAAANPTAEEAQRLEVLEARLETLRTQRGSLASGLEGPGSNALTIVEPASAPTEAFQPRTAINAALGALIGAAIGVVFVLLIPVRGDAAAMRRAQAASRR